MKYIIDSDYLNSFVEEIFFEKNFNGKDMLDEMFDEAMWVGNIPDSALQSDYGEELNNLNSKDKFIEEMRRRITTVWSIKIQNKMKKVMEDFTYAEIN